MQMMEEAADNGIKREEPTPDPSRAALVSMWQDRVTSAKRRWEKQFKQMKRGQKFAKGKQWPHQGEDDTRYVANIVYRHIKRRTAQLYAKNPRFIYERKPKLDFAMWDGSQKMLQEAMASMQAAMQPTMDPSMRAQQQEQINQSNLLIQDVTNGMQRKQLADRIGRTLELLVKYELDEQNPPFKRQMKQLIRRTLACKVGYVKLDFERSMVLRPEDQDKVRDTAQQIAKLEQMLSDKADGKMPEASAELEQLRLMLQRLQDPSNMVIDREGLVIDYPQSHRIIPDPGMTQLQGFLGCRFIAHEFSLRNDTIKQTYGVDVACGRGDSYSDHKPRPSWSFNGQNDGIDKDTTLVWEVQDKETGTVFTIADGYPDFLREPAAPNVQIDGFWTIFALTVNDCEDEDDPFPQSDVEMLEHIQIERNRSREGLREHRIAARPVIASRKGALTDEDKNKLMTHPPMAVVELEALAGDEKIEDVLQNLQKPGIDPNLYQTNHLEQDMSLVSGSQEAFLGGMSGGSATESSIAESSRMTEAGSDADELDDFLSQMARAIGQILLGNMSADTVAEVVGPGAVWPQLSKDEIMRELTLTVQAGSSGRPNKAADIANFERITPLILQIPGISPEWLARTAVKLLDDKTDLDEAIIAGLPPITAMVQAMQGQVTPQGGGATQGADASRNPAAQGAQGANNAPAPPGGQMNQGAMYPGAGPDPQQASLQ